MPAATGREEEVEQVVRRLAGWAQARPAVLAVALVGSWARRDARADSDVDAIVVSDDPEACLAADGLPAVLDTASFVGREQWGVVSSLRLRLPSGLELELGVAPASWASLDPLDDGTRAVVRDGFQIVSDGDGLLARLVQAVA